ncbi:hypothetical protein AgCh_024522 [Apium graveolens]
MGIGAVLMQEGHPLAFISKSLGPKLQNLSAYEKELLALLFAVQKWEQYLLGSHFIVKTDRKSLQWMLQQKLTTPFQQFWISKLMGFDYEIQYKKGVENVAVDALFRVQGAELLCTALFVSSSELPQLIKSSYQLDVGLTQIIQQLEQQINISHYKSQDGLLYKNGNIVVGPDANLRSKLINWHHASVEGGHSGREITSKRIKSLFYWKGMAQHVRQFVRACLVCQKSKTDSVASPGLLQPLPIPEEVWTDVSMDFISALPKSNGKNVIFVVVDSENSKDWSSWLPLAEWWYNTHYHTPAQITPYELVYNQPPPLHLPYLPGESTNHEVDRSFQRREAMLTKLKFHLIRSQVRMKQQADKHRSERNFKVGDWVWRKLQPYRQQTVASINNQKLASKYFGPFKVIATIGKAAYKLHFPPSVQIHNVFHVSQLKPVIGEVSLVVQLPGEMQITVPFNTEKVPETILDIRFVKVNNVAQVQFLVKWKDCPVHESFWEVTENFASKFPHLVDVSRGQDPYMPTGLVVKRSAESGIFVVVIMMK